MGRGCSACWVVLSPIGPTVVTIWIRFVVVGVPVGVGIGVLVGVGVRVDVGVPPVTITGTLAVWKLLVGVYWASNSEWAFWISGSNTLEDPTQAGEAISEIMVLPDPSLRIRW